LPNEDKLILCPFCIVVVLVIALFARLLDYNYDDEGEDEAETALAVHWGSGYIWHTGCGGKPA
jgi:hypothetical protein